MKRNAKINSRKLSTLICLVLTLVIAMTAMFVVTASAAALTETITFDANYTQRVSQDINSQVWKSDNVTFTNNKANSSTDIGNYSNPVRIYAGSTLTIECTGTMTQIVIVSDGTAKYKTALQNAITQAGYTYTTSSNNYTITLNSVTQIDLSFSTQARFKSITVTFEPTSTSDPDTPACEHNNTTKTTTPADCTTPGSIVTICDNCGEETGREVIPATGHKNGAPVILEPSCDADGSETITCETCGEETVTVLKATGHDFNGGICSKCGEKAIGYQLVTDITTLKAGDKIIIVAAGYDVALSTTQNTNNRAQVGITKNGNIAEIGNDTQVITLEAGTVDGTFAFKVDTGYLYAASSSSNHLKTQATLNDNASWEITIENSVATIKAKGNNSHNWMRYNDSSKLFSCYTSGQKDIAIYKLPECEHKAELDGAVVNLGQSLAIKYYINICEHKDIANYSMKFTMNDNTVTVTETSTDNNGTYFAFTGIAPQCMGDNVAAELLCDNETVLTNSEYSILANLKKLLEENPDDEKLQQLIYDALAYGAAAQKYLGYKTDALVNAGYKASQNAQPTDAHVLSALASGATASFKSAAVEFGDVNKIIVKINAADVANVTLKVGNTVLTLTEVADGVYSASSDAISALNLGAKVGFNLYVGEQLVQTLTYSVNDYASRKWNDAEMGELVKALYAYGVSAAAYAN